MNDLGLLLLDIPSDISGGSTAVVTPPSNTNPPPVPANGVMLTDDYGAPFIDEAGSYLVMTNEPLIVEDGSLVYGANTYVDLATVRNYAAVNGIDSKLPPTDAGLVAVVLNAMLWLEAQEPRYKGTRATATYRHYDGNGDAIQQALCWPRIGAYVHGFSVGMRIPPALIAAQCQLVCDITFGFEPFPNAVALQNNLKRSTIGPITKEYFNPATISGAPTQYFPKVAALLKPLLRSGAITSVRA